MIELIINSYGLMLLSVGMGSFIVFTLGLFFIIKHAQSTKPIHIPIKSMEGERVEPILKLADQPDHLQQKNDLEYSLKDISTIAGDDVMATQLDLARAYIETGSKLSAKKILEYVAEKGNLAQQKEALNLLNYI